MMDFSNRKPKYEIWDLNFDAFDLNCCTNGYQRTFQLWFYTWRQSRQNICGILYPSIKSIFYCIWNILFIYFNVLNSDWTASIKFLDLKYDFVYITEYGRREFDSYLHSFIAYHSIYNSYFLCKPHKLEQYTLVFVFYYKMKSIWVSVEI